MLVFLALGNAKELSFALGDAKVPKTNDFGVLVEYRLKYWNFLIQNKYLKNYAFCPAK